MSDALVRLSKAEQRIAAITTVEDAKDLAAQAEVIRRWAKKVQKNLVLQNQAALVKVLAERRGGQLLAGLSRERGTAAHRGKKSSLDHLTSFQAALKQAELNSFIADRWQLLATLDEAAIRAVVEALTDRHAEFTSSGLYLQTARQRQEQANKDALARQVEFESLGIYQGDFRERYRDVIPEASAQLVLTDPPYDKDAITLFGATAEAAAYVLRPGGSLLVYSGQKYLGEVLAAMTPHLRYWWTFALVHRGSAQLLQKLGIRCQWKPVLWFVKGTRGDVTAIVPDLVDGSGREKTDHAWQQAAGEAATLIERFTAPGDLVVDFCAGSGTVLVAAKQLDRRIAGFEARADHIQTIARRLA